MHLIPAAEPTGDPFWEEVRARHPDVTLVALPPSAPELAARAAQAATGAAAPRLLEPDELAAVRDEVHDEALRLWRGAVEAGDHQDAVVPDGGVPSQDDTWQRAPGPDRHHARVRARSRIVHSVRDAARTESTEGGNGGSPDGHQVLPFLDRLAAALDGWSISRTDGPVSRLDAERDGRSVCATYGTATGTCRLEVTHGWALARRADLAGERP